MGTAKSSDQTQTGALHALPRESYVDTQLFESEREKIFGREWVFVGPARSLPERSGALPARIAGVPIVFVTDEQGVTRAFQNICRHRGARLVSEPCNRLSRISCPYHRWSYSLSGALVSRPHYFGPNEHQRLDSPNVDEGLIPIGLTVWHDWVFVNLSRYPSPFSTQIAQAEEVLEGYDMDGLRWFHTLEFSVAGNWKLAVENFWDPTHSFAIHPQFMTAGTSDKRTPAAAVGNVIHGCVPYDDDAQVVDEPNGAVPKLPGLSSAVDRSFWLVLFPNFALSFLPTNLAVFEFQPVAPNQTVERIHLYMKDTIVDDPEFSSAREAVADFWRETNEQDIDAIRWMQDGRNCPGFDGGRLSPFWDSGISSFGRMVNDALRK